MLALRRRSRGILRLRVCIFLLRILSAGKLISVKNALTIMAHAEGTPAEQFFALQLVRNHVESQTKSLEPQCLRYVFVDERKFDFAVKDEALQSANGLLVRCNAIRGEGRARARVESKREEEGERQES